MYRNIIKPLFDIGAGVILLFIAAPFMIMTAVVLIAAHGRPVIFSQLRPGKDGKVFRLYKFRTMSDEMKDGVLLPDKDRLTGAGRIIRQLSLDELPQLLNVVRGELSLVGPRPLLVEYLGLYSAEQKRRHEVKPGITGWAQVNGRNAITWEEKFRLDVWYVDNISFCVDLKIILKTFTTIFKGSDVYDRSGSTMEKFRGNIK